MIAQYLDIKEKLSKKDDRLLIEGNLFSGTIKRNKNGIAEERNYLNGILHGLQKEFYSNGQLRIVTIYTNGNENGRRIEYYTCGSKKLNANYCDGSLDGLYEEWDESGILIMRKTFYKGKLIAIKSN